VTAALRRRLGEADGSATVLVVAVLAVLAVATGLVVETGLSIAARHHLAAVADSAALAAAAAVDAGRSRACGAAAELARRNGATITNCLVAGPVVTVRLSARVGWPLAWLGPLALNSRAGPADTNTDLSGQPEAPS